MFPPASLPDAVYAFDSVMLKLSLRPGSPRSETSTGLMRETGVLDRPIAFEEYVDTRFAEGAKHETE